MKMSELNHTSSVKLLERSSLWERDVFKITALDLQIFLKYHWGKYEYTLALAELSGLIKTMWDEALHGQLKNLPEIAFFEVPAIRMTTSEFSDCLSVVPIEYRRAIIFMLETGMSPAKVIELTHKDIELVKGLITEIALAAIQHQPKHPDLPFVFWHKKEGEDSAPLLDLPEAIMQVSQGMGIGSLRKLYKDMIYIDNDSDMAHFSALTDIPLGKLRTLH